MALIDDVKAACARLAPKGWGPLLKKHGLDITKAGLAAELAKRIAVDRTIPGFEDLAMECDQGIEPGRPDRSLLYHAFASHRVVNGVNGSELGAFPTLAEIQAVENYVYGVRPPSLAEIRRIAGRDNLAVAVFALEYRSAAESVQRMHAQLCFSRTGVGRVGNKPAHYDDKARGFTAIQRNDAHAIRVLPARYAAFIAVQRKGSEGSFGPLHERPGDNALDFWVPLHKLFDGKECIQGFDVKVQFRTEHTNEKLRRIHMIMRGSNWGEPDISQPPFIFHDGIAALSGKAAFGSGVLVPHDHAELVEVAKYKGKRLAFRVPPGSDTLSSSLSIPSRGDARLAPEYVHARHKLNANGTVADFNDLADPSAAVERGGYDALHYIDFTGDGWVKAEVTALASEVPRNVPAYSLVTAPDFFPECDQMELLEWTDNGVPTALRRRMWKVPPETLADTRMPANIQLTGVDLRAEDKTVTAVVSAPNDRPRQTALLGPPSPRHSCLPDAAAGVFAPGWDTSFTRNEDGVDHLAAFGLGSPFPEDAKLCAALSTFWPSAAPDAARTFQPDPNWPTVAPLTDEEIGSTGQPGWDGCEGPVLVQQGARRSVEYADFAHADYVQNALDGKFSLSLTGHIDVIEYRRRALNMARTYREMERLRLIGSAGDRGDWSLFSFRQVKANDAGMRTASTATGRTLVQPVYRFELYEHGSETRVAGDVRKVRIAVESSVVFFVDGTQLLASIDNGAWTGRTD